MLICVKFSFSLRVLEVLYTAVFSIGITCQCLMVLLNTWQQMRSDLGFCGCRFVAVWWFDAVSQSSIATSSIFDDFKIFNDPLTLRKKSKVENGKFQSFKAFHLRTLWPGPAGFAPMPGLLPSQCVECMSYELHIDIIDIMMYLKRCDFGGFEVVKDVTSDGNSGKYVSKHWVCIVCFELRRGLGALARAWRVLSKSSCWISSVLFLNSILRAARERTTWIRVYKGTRFELLKELPLRPVNVTHVLFA